MPPRKKTKETVTPQRVALSIKSRFNPIRNLTPAILAQQLERFDAGYLRGAALTWDKIEHRDDVLKSVAPKRKKAVSRHGYEIVALDESAEAQRHKDTLEYFYNNLTCTSGVDLNVRGGVSLLVRQMMDAVGKQYAVHEVIWEPGGEGLTATIKYVPLWFFENTTGKLRYLPSDGAVAGEDLAPAEWIVTVGDGLMAACSVAYMYKHLPLKDWLVYCERHGMPGIRGVTSATRGSAEWNRMVEAVEDFATDFAAVMNESEKIEPINIETKGQLPYPKLVERMDRAMASLWRGADLSTMSSGSGEGTGASLQGEEADILENDDATMISEVLNEQVDRWVIRYALGDDRALAYIKLNTGVRQDVKQDIEVDRFLIEQGFPVAVTDVLERYGRPLPGDDEQLISGAELMANARRQRSESRGQRSGHAALSNSEREAEVRGQSKYVARRLEESALDRAAMAFATDLQPLRERLAYVLDSDDDEFLFARLKNLQGELPDLLLEINREPAGAGAIESALTAGLFNGFAEASETKHAEAA